MQAQRAPLARETPAELLERSADLALLRVHLDEVAESHGRLVLVAGEAGVGKTALLRSFCDERRRAGRVLWGACDPLFTPRPLGPFVDVAAEAGGELEEVVAAGGTPHNVAVALARELASHPPTILVLEDLHWADGATLDVLRLLGRRIDTVATLVLASYRHTELGRFHPLRVVLGELGTTPSVSRLRIAPLSEEAVAALAAPYGADAAELYRTTGGNPFFATEVLAAGAEAIPSTVRDAVLARAARLSPGARHVLEAVAIVPPQAELWLLQALVGEAVGHLEECVASGMLTATPRAVAFRHELARLAVEDSVPADRRLVLHRAALAALAAPPSSAPDLARLAHHAEWADDGDAVVRFAPPAAERAAALGAHREAAAQYARALRFADGVSTTARAELCERRAFECFLTTQDDEAVAAGEEALSCSRLLGDRRREGSSLRFLAQMRLNMGQAGEADRTAREAAALLEQLPPGPELALTYCLLAALAMLSEDAGEVVAWTDRATEIAERVGDAQARISALGTLGGIEALRGQPGGRAKLERTLELAEQAGLDHQVGRAHLFLGMAASRERSLARMDLHVRAGLGFCAERGLEVWGHFLLAMRSWLELERGDWEAATDTVAIVLSKNCRTSCMQANIVLGVVRARRGDPDPWTPLAEASAVAEQTGQFWWLSQVAAARAEAAWLEGNDDLVLEATEEAYTLALRQGSPWPIGELAGWRRRAGVEEPVPDRTAGPFALESAGAFREAAELWRTFGCPYEGALALAGSDDEGALRESLDELNRLGARPAAAIAARRLRERGARGLPRGPRAATRVNPAGLTPRELEVLELLADGLGNGEIAKRLHLSEKTVHHHVSSILRKLRVRSRGQAAAQAVRLGIARLPG